MSGNKWSVVQTELIFRPVPDLLDQVWQLRPQAWQARMPAFPDIAAWRDDFDDCSDHWVIVDAGRVVAAARLTIRATIDQLPHPELYRHLTIAGAGPFASINRLVVDAAYSGKGLSRQLDQARLAHADAAGVTMILATTFAGLRRVRALEALGFAQVGPAPNYAHGPLREVNHALEGGGRQCSPDARAAQTFAHTVAPTITMARAPHD